MFNSRLMVSVAATAFACVMWVAAPQTHAQPSGDSQKPQNRSQGDQAQRGERGQRGNRGDMRERMAERMKEALHLTDEEWKAVSPKLEKVQTLSRELRFGGMMGMMRGQRGERGQRGPGADNAGNASGQSAAPQSALAKAGADLRAALENKSATTDDIKAKLSALRTARSKAHEELSKAQEDLRSLLDFKQEAQLVMMGILD